MALEYIHGRKVLHRDIKASNIFLTGNNTVKLGDFGISRVLENTWDAAQTVVGTPYYMSPEVCENKPYTYKSDAWSLGCVLYELCTLEHAFSADNLLGLVYKIVQDKQAPIPAWYSEDLRSIVECLLLKDSTKRPLVSDLLLTPFAKQKMEEFIENGGFIGNQHLHVKKLKSKKFEDSTHDSSEEVSSLSETCEEAKRTPHKSKSFQEANHNELTPKEKMMLNKKREADAKANKLKDYTRDAIHNYSDAKQRMYEEFYHEQGADYDGGKLKKGHKSHRVDSHKHILEGGKAHGLRTANYPRGVVVGDPKKVVISNYWTNPIDEKEELKFQEDPMRVLGTSSQFSDSFGANDRCEDTYMSRSDKHESTFAANDRAEETFFANDRFGHTNLQSSKGADTFKLSESNGTFMSSLSLEDSSAHTMQQPLHKASSYDERKIVSSGKYDPEEYYYNYERYLSDEFEEDDEDNTTETSRIEAEKDPKELTSIVDNYKHFLNNEKPEVQNDKDEVFIKEQEKLEKQINRMEDLPIQETAKLQLQIKKDQIMKDLGEDLYEKVYTILKRERKNGTEDRVIHKKLRKHVPHSNSKMISKCFDLDQIVFMEILRGE